MADLLGIRRLTEGNSFGVVCPYCGDTRGKMNFRIMKDGHPANTYHCFASGCGAKGNMLTLYADMKGLYGPDRYKIAYRQICEELGTRSLDKSQGADSRGYQAEPDAGPDKKDAVYRRLLELLILSWEHKRKLLERGLTERQIVDFQFRSTPVSGTEGIVKRLIKEGYSVSGVPGFFFNSRNNWDIAFYRKNQGILCPAFDLEGRISGFQIRLDMPYDGRKYLWLSSSNKYRGTGSKSPVTFLGDPRCRVLCVTEGILKPLVAHALSGYSFLGTPGVNQYKELEKALVALKQNGLEEVQEYYDMDKLMDVRCGNDYEESVCADCRENETKEGKICPRKERKRNQIQEGCVRLYDICKALKLRRTRKVWDRNNDGNWAGNLKGIDDYWYECLKKRKGWEYGLG